MAILCEFHRTYTLGRNIAIFDNLLQFRATFKHRIVLAVPYMYVTLSALSLSRMNKIYGETSCVRRLQTIQAVT